MGDVIYINRAKFGVGELIEHKMFGYRGVIVDVDTRFSLTDAWYDQVAQSRPPKDKPWYHILVHDAEHTTYVAERNLQQDMDGTPVNHPMITYYFSEFDAGRYLSKHTEN